MLHLPLPGLIPCPHVPATASARPTIAQQSEHSGEAVVSTDANQRQRRCVPGGRGSLGLGWRELDWAPLHWGSSAVRSWRKRVWEQEQVHRL